MSKAFGVRWTKALREFWSERTRGILVVLAMSMGIAGFMAVLASYAILTRALNDGYLATNPASATLTTDTVDEKMLQAILADHDISDAEARRTVTGRIKAGPAEWRNLQLFIVQDFQQVRVGKLQPEKGAWPPTTGEILIERDAFQVARANIGDTVLVKTVNGHDQELRVAGSVHDVGQAQARMENIVYGYITMDTLALLGERTYFDQVKILVANDRMDISHVKEMAEKAKRQIESTGHSVTRIDVPKPGEHPHAAIMGLLLLTMSSFGLFVLGLSGILVVNLITAWMAKQGRQIGIMKTLGGSQLQIAQVYIGQAVLLGMTAIVIALPVGILGSRILCRSMAVFLNFDVTDFSVPVWVYFLVALAGVVVPLLAAAYPVWKGCSISIREALADNGVAQNTFGDRAFDRALSNIGGLTRPFLLALRNSFRRRTRLVLTVVTLTASGLFFMSALNVRSSMVRTLDQLFALRKFDLSINLGTSYPMESVERAARNTPGIKKVEGWITTQGSIPKDNSGITPLPSIAPEGHGGAATLHGGGGASMLDEHFAVVALPQDSAMIDFNVVEGNDLKAAKIDSMLINNALAAKDARFKVGNSVKLGMGPAVLEWHIVGITQEPFSPPVAYISKKFFEQFGNHAGMVNSLRVSVLDPGLDALKNVRAEFDRNLEQSGIRPLASSTNTEARYGFDMHMKMIYVFLIIMSCILVGVGGLGLMNTLSLNVLERRREMGVLRAIGASPRYIWLIVITEGMMVSVMSWALAAVLAWPLTSFLGNSVLKTMFKSQINFATDYRGLLIWFVVSVVLAVVASFVPAWQAARRPVREALAYE